MLQINNTMADMYIDVSEASGVYQSNTYVVEEFTKSVNVYMNVCMYVCMSFPFAEVAIY
jgi:hypothetical protein